MAGRGLRAVAFDNYRAAASSRALDQLLQQETLDWKERAEQFRLQEWALHEVMLRVAWAASSELRKHRTGFSLRGLVKLYELVSTLGRRAVGMPLDYVQPKICFSQIPQPSTSEWSPPLFRSFTKSALYPNFEQCRMSQRTRGLTHPPKLPLCHLRKL